MFGIVLIAGGLGIVLLFYSADIAITHMAPGAALIHNSPYFSEHSFKILSVAAPAAGIGLLVAGLIYFSHLLFPRIRQMEKDFNKRASTDALTRAYNRLKFDEILEREMKRATRYQKLLSVAVFDIDHFKKVNDTYGHLVGDYVLQSIADITRDNIRGTDYLLRWGGEEFIIILPETNVEKAEELAVRIKHSIEGYDFRRAGHITVSFGVTQLKKGDSDKEFIKRADDAMYKAKALGRNRVEVGV
jgi:diguanylate cyclase (GGDEF)-like protein